MTSQTSVFRSGDRKRVTPPLRDEFRLSSQATIAGPSPWSIGSAAGNADIVFTGGGRLSLSFEPASSWTRALIRTAEPVHADDDGESGIEGPESAALVAAYLHKAREELLNTRSDTPPGFREQGFIVDFKEGRPETRGEATLHTAIAAVALATGNYHQDQWDRDNANARLEELLNALLHKGWGNRDDLTREHPIRYPDKFDYDRAGNKIRQSPLTKDSFGAICAAALYAYRCPHSSSEVREAARRLMRKWSEYLVLHQWRTHSTYITGEFDARRIAGEDDDYYAHIFSEPGVDENGNPLDEDARKVMYKGPEGFLLLPHELYALQNVAAQLGIPTNHWNIWTDAMPAALKQTMADIVAPIIGAAVGRGLDYILNRLIFAVPYSIPLGPSDWEFGKIEGIFEIRIPSATRRAIVDAVSKLIRDVIREGVRLQNFDDHQRIDLIGLVVNRVLDVVPDGLGRNSWRSILTGAMQQVCPWLNGTVWVEAVTFLAILQLLKKINFPDNPLLKDVESQAEVVSYTLWSFAAECETRPEMEDLLKPFVQEFFSFLRGDGNPNGLWAWLAEDSGRVNEQLRLFESSPARLWSKFAYGSTKFSEWAADTVPEHERDQPNKQCARLDYLVLRGLSEKGPPRGFSDVVSDWWQAFIDAVQNAAAQFIALINDQLERVGSYTREAIDGAGNLIRETWTAAGEFNQEQIRNGEIILKRSWDNTGRLLLRFTLQMDGKWIEEYWNRTSEKYWKGVWADATATGDKMLERTQEQLDGKWIKETWGGAQKYWKGIWDKRGSGSKMLSRFKEQLDGKWVEEYWNKADRASKYWKGVWENRSNSGKMLSRFKEQLDGKWIEEYWNRTSEKYWKGVWADARATGDKMLERTQEQLDGKWIKETWGGAQKYWKGIWDKRGSGSKMLSRFKEQLDGKWVEEYWNKADRASKYWKGVWENRSNSGKMLSRFKEQLDGKWVEEYWNKADRASKYWKGVWENRSGAGKMLLRFKEQFNGKWVEERWGGNQKYWRGVWDKFGDGAKMLERYVNQFNGNTIVETWNSAREYGKSIFDSRGRLIRQIGNSPIRLPNWWPPF